METISVLLAFVRGIHRSTVDSPHKGQWHRALMFSLMCASTNGWTNNRDLRCHSAHYDLTVMGKVDNQEAPNHYHNQLMCHHQCVLTCKELVISIIVSELILYFSIGQILWISNESAALVKRWNEYCSMSIGPPILRYSYFKFDHENPQSRSCVCGQRSRSHLTLKIQRSRSWSRSNPLVTFEAWSSIDMFAFRFVVIGPFMAEI